MRAVAIVIIAIIIAVLGFIYLESKSTSSETETMSQEERAVRCEALKQKEEGVEVLGYRGRVKQILLGCF